MLIQLKAEEFRRGSGLPAILPPGLKVCVQRRPIPSERPYSAPYTAELGASLIPCLSGHPCAYPDST